jgi:hypothetical protein
MCITIAYTPRNIAAHVPARIAKGGLVAQLASLHTGPEDVFNGQGHLPAQLRAFEQLFLI